MISRDNHVITTCFARANCVYFQRKGQEDREKGLQQRNTELQARIKQLEEKVNSLNSENESLVSGTYSYLLFCVFILMALRLASEMSGVFDIKNAGLWLFMA